MRSISLGPRTQAALVLALFALVGALLGILGDRIVAQQRADTAQDSTMRDVMQRRGDGPRRGPGMSRFADQLATRLDLSGDQRAATDARPRSQPLTNATVMADLTAHARRPSRHRDLPR